MIFPCSLPRGPQSTFLRGTPRDESCHEGTVIPQQHQHAGVGFVQAVILRKPRLLGRFVAGFGYQRRSRFMPEGPSLSSNTSSWWTNNKLVAKDPTYISMSTAE